MGEVWDRCANSLNSSSTPTHLAPLLSAFFDTAMMSRCDGEWPWFPHGNLVWLDSHPSLRFSGVISPNPGFAIRMTGCHFASNSMEQFAPWQAWDPAALPSSLRLGGGGSPPVVSHDSGCWTEESGQAVTVEWSCCWTSSPAAPFPTVAHTNISIESTCV